MKQETLKNQIPKNYLQLPQRNQDLVLPANSRTSCQQQTCVVAQGKDKNVPSLMYGSLNDLQILFVFLQSNLWLLEMSRDGRLEG